MALNAVTALFGIIKEIITIGDAAFCDCSSLIEITIPETVTAIDSRAFNYCQHLAAVY